jgi:hypothetical protein
VREQCCRWLRSLTRQLPPDPFQLDADADSANCAMANESMSRRPRLIEDNPGRSRRIRLVVACLWLTSLGGTYLLLRTTIAPEFGHLSGELKQVRRELADATAEIQRLQALVAQHERGQQVAERANQELQQALAGRQEEVASLRNDLSFFQRLMEGGSQQPGLGVHSLVLRASKDPRTFQFALTLSQNLKRNRQASGTVELTISGADGEHSARLGLAELGGAGPTLEFSFKYFQQLTGLIMLPEGFKPASVRLKVLPEGSGPIEREFMWKDVVTQGDS